MSNVINVVVKNADSISDDVTTPDTGWYTSTTSQSASTAPTLPIMAGVGFLLAAAILLMVFSKKKIFNTKDRTKKTGYFFVLAALVLSGIGTLVSAITSNVAAKDDVISFTSSDTTITVVREAGADTAYGVATAKITLNDATPLGYNIFAYTPDGNVLKADTGDGAIKPVVEDNSALTNNTWGIALTSQTDVKAEDKVWNAVGEEDNPLLVASFDNSTAAGTTVILHYGVLVDSTLPVGVYSANVEYKAYQRAYNVTFDANEGEVIESTKPVMVGEAIGTLPTPTRTNYNFLGWYTEKVGGTKIDENTVPSGHSTYYAHWERITYNVTFNPNEGAITTGSAEKTVQAGESLGTLPEAARDNYTFTGWYTEETGGERITTATIPTGATTYWAHWSRNTYTITFDAGDGVMDSQDTERNINAGDAIGTLPEATKTNHTLDGWYTEANGGTKISADTIPDSTTTYYAHYDRIEYTITYDLNGGNIGGNTTNPTATVLAGNTLGTLPENPAKENHTFAGWYTEKTGGEQITANTTPNTTTTYYAHYDRIEYNITYDLNGGNISGNTTNPTATVLAGNTLGTLPENPAKENHTFTGWYTEKTGGEQITANTTPNTTTTYYAHYDRIEYNITYNLNGGNINGSTTNPAVTVQAGNALGIPPVVARDDYILAGWYTAANGGVRVTPDSIPTSSDTYFAHWVGNSFPVAWSHDGACTFNATKNSGSTVSYPEEITGNQCEYAGDEKGYIDTGIALYTDGDNGNIDKDYEIGFTIETYVAADNGEQATFVNTKQENGSTYPGVVARVYKSNKDKMEISSKKTSSSNEHKYITINTPMSVRIVRKESEANPGYKAIYYAINDGDLIELNDLSQFNPSFNLNVWFGAAPANVDATSAQRYLNGTLSNMYIKLGEYGGSSASTYAINFNAAGGTTLEPTRTIIAGYKLDTLPAPTRNGYVFDGWYTAASGGTKITANTIPSSNTTYYAHWLAEYTIIYDANGRTFADDNTTNQVDYIGNSTTGTYKEPVGTDTYVFMGWGTASTDTAATYTTEDQVKAYYSANPGQAVTLYAVWANALTVYFDGNGSTEGTMNPIYIPAGTSQNLPANTFEKDGHEFASWNTDASGEGTSYNDKASFSAGVVTPGQTTTLYAQWEEVTTFDKAYEQAGKTKHNGYYTMQDATSAICDNVTAGQTGTLIDARDNTTYRVAKLADDRCWMLENLALDLMDTDVKTAMLDSTDTKTNASYRTLDYLFNGGGSSPYTNYAVANANSSNYYDRPAIAKSGTCNNASCVNNPTSGNWTYDSVTQTTINNVTSYAQGKIGIYYNYCAASAGSYCYASNVSVDRPDTAIDAAEDICPSGWRMPTGGPISTSGDNNGGGEFQNLYNKYNNAKSFQEALSTPLSGYFNYGKASRQGVNGNFWSSTRDSGYFMHNLYVDSTIVYSQVGNGRDGGFSMRCIVDPINKYDITVSMDANTESVTFDSMYGSQTVTTDGGTVSLREGVTYTITASFANGYEFSGWSNATNSTIGDASSNPTTYTVTGDSTLTVVSKKEVMTFDKAYEQAGKTKHNGYYTMQDATSAICTAVEAGQTGTLIDTRDDQTYAVGKLADNKCWMIENLNLAGGTALSADDTDVTSTYINGFTTGGNLTKDGNTIVLPASATKNSNNNNLTDNSQFSSVSNAYVYNSGNKTNCGAINQNTPCYSYYSWIAATLGGKQDNGSTAQNNNGYNAAASICPKGWKLPTSTTSNANAQNSGNWKTGDWYALATAYGANLESNYHQSSNTFYNNAGPGTTPNFLLAGYYYSGSFYNGGSRGYYWSATSLSSAAAYRLLFYSGYVNSAEDNLRSYGTSVRCLLGS